MISRRDGLPYWDEDQEEEDRLGKKTLESDIQVDSGLGGEENRSGQVFGGQDSSLDEIHEPQNLTIQQLWRVLGLNTEYVSFESGEIRWI